MLRSKELVKHRILEQVVMFMMFERFDKTLIQALLTCSLSVVRSNNNHSGQIFYTHIYLL